MKNKMIISIFLMISSILLLQNTVLAFGSTQKNIRSEVNSGQTTEFTILFWNVLESSFPVELRSRQVPEGMSVILEPEKFELEPSKVTSFPAEKGRDYVSTQYGLMLTTPINISVKVADTVEPGEYSILITATAGKPTTGISTLLEKTFRLTVVVTGSKPEIKPEEIEDKKQKSIPEQISEQVSKILDLTKTITGIVTAPTAKTNIITLFITIVIILAISWLIYKRV